MIKKLTIIIIAIFFSHCHHTPVKNARWKFFGETQRGSRFYYDPESITYSGKDLVTVRVKEFPSEEENICKIMLLMLQEIPALHIPPGEIKGYENHSYSLIFYEINCSDRTIIPTSTHDYDKEGNVIYSSTNDKEIINAMMECINNLDITISSGTAWEFLYRDLCP